MFWGWKIPGTDNMGGLSVLPKDPVILLSFVNTKLRDEYGIAVYPIVTVRQIIDFLHNRPIDGKVYIDDAMRERMEAYLRQYGATA